MTDAGAKPTTIAPVARTLRVSELDLPLRIRRGLVAGTIVEDICARSISPVSVGEWDQATEWDTVGSGQIGVGLPIADGTVTIVSDSPLDTLGGTGAQSLSLEGLGLAAAPTTEGDAAPWVRVGVPLNGTTPVVTSTQFYRGLVDAGGVATVGSTMSNQGTITITRTAGGVVQHIMPPTQGVLLPYRRTVPTGWIGILRGMIPNWNGSPQANWRLREHTVGGLEFSALGGSIQRENSGTQHEIHDAHLVPAGTTFWWEVVRDAGGANDAFMSITSTVEFYKL